VSDCRPELDRVLALAREGAELLRAEAARADGPRGAGAKAPVDDEICALLVDGLRAAFPEDAVVSEELPPLAGTSGRAFVIDPHDGTSHFLRGSRDTSISIGLVAGGELLLGVVYAPLPSPLTGPDGLLVSWARGAPLLRNGAPVAVGERPRELGPGALVLASPRMRPQVRAWNEAVLDPARLEGCGSFATRLALVATGDVAGGYTLRNQLGPWDYAGGQALLRAAGGALVDDDGDRIGWADAAPASEDRHHFFAGATLDLARELARRYREAFEALGRLP